MARRKWILLNPRVCTILKKNRNLAATTTASLKATGRLHARHWRHTGATPCRSARMAQGSAGAVTSALLELERQMSAGRIDYRSCTHAAR